jgi:hypothetical protein
MINIIVLRNLTEHSGGQKSISPSNNGIKNIIKNGNATQDILAIRQSSCSTEEGYRKSQPIRWHAPKIAVIRAV